MVLLWLRFVVKVDCMQFRNSVVVLKEVAASLIACVVGLAAASKARIMFCQEGFLVRRAGLAGVTIAGSKAGSLLRARSCSFGQRGCG